MAGKNPKDTPRDIADDRQASMQPGENFQPRNRGEVSDAMDRDSAARARELAARDADASLGTIAQTEWEERVERGEEWQEEQVPEREARGDEEADSEVSRRGLVNPPPEE
ncbi:hypothetical protein [Hyalangium gracile]|uniref:hypothetical protein n=1 Tax=Hyalangium gracile TaxID=394092 RepID=UPI001CCA1FE6|nr:hypothetical protein [Hyalangium gracile]